MAENRLLEAVEIRKSFVSNARLFSKKRHVVRAVDGVSLAVGRGETLGLVGESGCGKSTLGNCLMRIVAADAGRVEIMGPDGVRADFLALRGQALGRYRRMMQMVFQDPYSSINPRMTVKDVVGEPLLLGGVCRRGAEYDERVAELMRIVGLSPEQMERYPHAFSGGQRQRVGIARALSTSPAFILCDEAVSALDVSVKAQILNLFMELQDRFHFSYLFISHDLSVVRHISSRVAIMYLGRIVEEGDIEDIFGGALHPYTALLLSAVPNPDPDGARLRGTVREDVGQADRTGGCSFFPRCRRALPACRDAVPALTAVSATHKVACFFPEEESK